MKLLLGLRKEIMLSTLFLRGLDGKMRGFLTRKQFGGVRCSIATPYTPHFSKMNLIRCQGGAKEGEGGHGQDPHCEIEALLRPRKTNSSMHLGSEKGKGMRGPFLPTIENRSRSFALLRLSSSFGSILPCRCSAMLLLHCFHPSPTFVIKES